MLVISQGFFTLRWTLHVHTHTSALHVATVSSLIAALSPMLNKSNSKAKPARYAFLPTWSSQMGHSLPRLPQGRGESLSKYHHRGRQFVTRIGLLLVHSQLWIRRHGRHSSPPVALPHSSYLHLNAPIFSTDFVSKTAWDFCWGLHVGFSQN